MNLMDFLLPSIMIMVMQVLNIPYKITYSNDAKAILPGYSTGQSYKEHIF